MTFDPKKRITVAEALAHPFLAAYHDPDDEPVAPPLRECLETRPRGASEADLPRLRTAASFFDFDHHKDSITREDLKKLLFNEVMQFQVSFWLPSRPSSALNTKLAASRLSDSHRIAIYI